MTEEFQPAVRLGKKEYQHDDRTLFMARYVLPDVRVPSNYDFDVHRSPVPLRVWGNDEWGNCVIAGEANHLLRMERVEQRRTLPVTDQDVIDRYKMLTGSQSPGDDKDEGLVILNAMQNWKNSGWTVQNRNYKIAAYGELEPADRDQLRMASYVLHGIHLGFWLPLAARQMTRERVWHYEGQTGPEWQPGSWGGHLVYSKAFTEDGYEILTWGSKVKVTNEFVAKYADEAWAVVDNLDSWKIKQTIDVAKLTESLSQISTKVNE
jgi:hypothetical protein